jgi:hypothetical protein
MVRTKEYLKILEETGDMSSSLNDNKNRS